MQIQPVKQLRGEVSVPGDKSISHRSIMFGALAKGTTEITHFLHGADCLSTIGCFRAMGINIEDTPDRILVHGKGLHGLSEPSSFLDVGNSGTTTRLISGILSGQPFATTLSGDASLNSRPMKRIMEPLGMMGADILLDAEGVLHRPQGKHPIQPNAGEAGLGESLEIETALKGDTAYYSGRHPRGQCFTASCTFRPEE